MLLIASSLFLVPQLSLSTAYCLLPAAHCLLPTAYCLLPPASFLLPSLFAYYLLPTAKTSGIIGM